MPDRYPLDQSLKNSADVMDDAVNAATEAVDEARQTIAERLSTTADYVRSHRCEAHAGGRRTRGQGQSRSVAGHRGGIRVRDWPSRSLAD